MNHIWNTERSPAIIDNFNYIFEGKKVPFRGRVWEQIHLEKTDAGYNLTSRVLSQNLFQRIFSTFFLGYKAIASCISTVRKSIPNKVIHFVIEKESKSTDLIQEIHRISLEQRISRYEVLQNLGTQFSYWKQLCTAIRNGDAESAAVAIERGAPLDRFDKFGNTPLHYACNTNNLDCVRILLSQGVSVSDKNVNGFTPLDLAAGQGNIEMVELLIAHGASANESAHGIYSAASKGHLDVVRLLLANNASLVGQVNQLRSFTAFDGAINARPSNWKEIVKAIAEKDPALHREALELNTRRYLAFFQNVGGMTTLISPKGEVHHYSLTPTIQNYLLNAVVKGTQMFCETHPEVMNLAQADLITTAFQTKGNLFDRWTAGEPVVIDMVKDSRDTPQRRNISFLIWNNTMVICGQWQGEKTSGFKVFQFDPSHFNANRLDSFCNTQLIQDQGFSFESFIQSIIEKYGCTQSHKEKGLESIRLPAASDSKEGYNAMTLVLPLLVMQKAKQEETEPNPDYTFARNVEECQDLFAAWQRFQIERKLKNIIS